MELSVVLGLDGAPSAAVLLGVKVIPGVSFNAKEELDHLGEEVQLEELTALAGTL